MSTLSTMRTVGIAALFAASSACFDDGADALRVLVPDVTSFSWNPAFDAVDDGVVAFVPFDVFVYRALDGSAVPGAVVELRVDGAAVISASELSFSDAACAGCGWDVYSDLLFELGDAALSGDQGRADDGHVDVSRRSFVTDAAGMVRAYVMIDAVDAELEVITQVYGLGLDVEASAAGEALRSVGAPVAEASSSLLPR